MNNQYKHMQEQRYVREEQSSTGNAMLVILLLLVIGFIAWFVIGRDQAGTGTGGSEIDVELDGDINGSVDGGGTGY